jgi:hypothetical protein
LPFQARHGDASPTEFMKRGAHHYPMSAAFL